MYAQNLFYKHKYASKSYSINRSRSNRADIFVLDERWEIPHNLMKLLFLIKIVLKSHLLCRIIKYSFRVFEIPNLLTKLFPLNIYSAYFFLIKNFLY